MVNNMRDSSSSFADTVFEEVDVPGMSGMRILSVSKAVNNFDKTNFGTKTPWYMVSLKVNSEILSSNIDGKYGTNEYKNFCELFGFHIAVSRETGENVNDQLFTAGCIKHENCTIHIPQSDYAVELGNFMNNGTIIKEIKIVGLGRYNDEMQPYEEIIFEDSSIVSIIPSGDDLFVTFNVSKKERFFRYFDQTGKPGGKAVCKVDIYKDTSSATKE